MANCRGRRKCAFFTLLAICIAIAVSAIVLGVLSLVEVSTGEPTNAWYLMGAASVAILLLPFVVTPLMWVAVELLIQQARASGATSELATDTANIVLQVEERRTPPARQYGSVSNSCDQMQAAEHATEEDLPHSPSAVSTVDTTDRVSPPARLNGNNSKTTANEEFQSSHDVPPEVDAVEVIKRRPTAVTTREGQFLELEFYDAQSHRVDCSQFQSLSMAACAMLCIALMCFSLSLMFLMWSIFIGVRYNKQQDYFWSSIVCNVGLNILCPAFGIIGVLLILNVVTYTSAGQIDFRVLYCFMLASVKIVNGEMVDPPKLTFRVWVIGDLFYLRLRSPQGNPKHLRYYIDRTPTTYLLAAIMGIAFTLAAWLCLEAMLVDRVTVTTPVTEEDCSGYTCVHGWTPMSCSEVLNITDKVMLNCILFRVQFNILNSSNELVIALLLYIGAVQLLKLVVIIVAFLLLIHQTKLWGVVLLISHILLLMAILVIVIVMDTIDLPSKAKLTAIPILFIPMDFILLSGRVKEVIREPQRTRGVMVQPEEYFEGLHHMTTFAHVTSPQSEA